MGIFESWFNKKVPESSFVFDFDLFGDISKKTYMKRLAVETCISFLARTISQTEFRVKVGGEHIVDDLYYRLNKRPNKNQTASTFWQQFVSKLVWDNEVLVIVTRDEDLLIADNYQHNKYALLDDTFTNVVVREFEFDQTFYQNEVIHLKYSNEDLSVLIDRLFSDYGELFGRILSAQKRKNQVRSTVNVDASIGKTKEGREELQSFINKLYQSFETKDFAIVPQQPGYEYSEKTLNVPGQTVDEVNKVSNGFLEQVAMAMGIPFSLLRGDMADVEKQTKNYMFFTVSPLLEKIKDECEVKFIEKVDYFKGDRIDVRKPSYRDIFDLATAVDKLISSGAFNGNEIRSELGHEMTDEEIHSTYVMTKNYQTGSEALEGGDNE